MKPPEVKDIISFYSKEIELPSERWNEEDNPEPTAGRMREDSSEKLNTHTKTENSKQM